MLGKWVAGVGAFIAHSCLALPRYQGVSAPHCHEFPAALDCVVLNCELKQSLPLLSCFSQCPVTAMRIIVNTQLQQSNPRHQAKMSHYLIYPHHPMRRCNDFHSTEQKKEADSTPKDRSIRLARPNHAFQMRRCADAKSTVYFAWLAVWLLKGHSQLQVTERNVCCLGVSARFYFSFAPSFRVSS